MSEPKPITDKDRMDWMEAKRPNVHLHGRTEQEAGLVSINWVRGGRSIHDRETGATFREAIDRAMRHDQPGRWR